MSRKRKRYRLLKGLAVSFIAFALLTVMFRTFTRIAEPPPGEPFTEQPERTRLGADHYVCLDSWLKKNEFGLWEMYLKGDAYELGIKHGILAAEQIRHQEEVFVAGIREMVPSDRYLRFLKQVVVWMNRKLDDHIPLEFQQEILGVSQQASETFDFIGPPYQRMLNYHAAHDIGHALQNMNLVACTAFGVNGSRSADSSLLVGRNFDFSMGDDFAKEKIVAFYDPSEGNRFASITWGGMIGVVSGMNEHGLVVTLNAAKSGIPASSKTPTSILARQILQYASNIREAWEIAGRSEIFVSESFLISSALDNRTVVIEKAPENMAMYESADDVLILTNHFQSDTFKNSKRTLQNKKEGASVYRWERTGELLGRQNLHDEGSFASILRDRAGKNDVSIGMGNEKAINQLIAHHSVIFKPDEREMWVSAFPYCLGTYVHYDLDSLFSDQGHQGRITYQSEKNIPEDPFLSDPFFTEFNTYREETKRIRSLLEEGGTGVINSREMEGYLDLNPDYYHPYYIAGEWYRLTGHPEKAMEMYDRALQKEIPRQVDRDQILEAKEEINNE